MYMYICICIYIYIHIYIYIYVYPEWEKLGEANDSSAGLLATFL